MFYISFMITKKEKSTIETQNINRGTEKITRENHQFTKVGRNRWKRKPVVVETIGHGIFLLSNICCEVWAD